MPIHASDFIERNALRALTDQFPELDHFVSQNYVLTKKIGNVSIYEIKPLAATRNPTPDAGK